MARKSRAGCGVLVLVLVVVVVAGLLVVLDPWLHRRTERQVAAQLQTSLGTPAPPTVDIRGTPFLTQAVRNHFGQVDVSATQLSGQDQAIPVQALQVHLYDVRTADRYRKITAGRLDGQATIGYDAVSTLAKTPITFAGADAGGQGRVQTQVSTTIFGQTLSATLSGVLGVDEPDQTLVVTDPAVQVAGLTVPTQLVDSLAGQFLPPIPVGQLPLGVRLVSVQTTGSGVVAELGGTDVVVSGG